LPFLISLPIYEALNLANSHSISPGCRSLTEFQSAARPQPAGRAGAI
jgi:hypothetical protein